MKQMRQHGTMGLYACFLGTCLYAMWKQFLVWEQTVKVFREVVGTVWGKFRKQHCFSRQYLFYDLSTIQISIHPTVILLVFITSFESIIGAIPIAIMRKVTEKVA